jgi:hypothetical protein
MCNCQNNLFKGSRGIANAPASNPLIKGTRSVTNGKISVLTETKKITTDVFVRRQTNAPRVRLSSTTDVINQRLSVKNLSASVMAANGIVGYRSNALSNRDRPVTGYPELIQQMYNNERK